MSEHLHDELFWTAVQYAAGDLPDDAATEFEQRLEADQAAREALAEAVALTDAVAQAEAMPVSPAGGERHRWAVAVAGIAVMTAACLAVMFVSRTSPSGDQIAAKPGDVQLAAAWVEGQNETVVAPVDEVLLLAEAADDEDFELPPMSAEPTAPDWLIAAVIDASGPATQGEN